MCDEAMIIINGFLLNPSQSMTMRKATEAFLDEMKSPDILGSDDMGRNLAASFARRCEQVLGLIDMEKGRSC